MLGGRNTGGRERVAAGETVKERQETLSCYIITTPGVKCILFKIHVFSPPPTLADHGWKMRLVGLIVITRQIEPGLVQNAG